MQTLIWLSVSPTCSTPLGDRDPQRDLERASELTRKTLVLDDADPGGFYLSSAINLVKGQYAQSMDDANRGIALDPSNPFGYVWLASALILSGKPAEGIDAAETAMRLDPQRSDSCLSLVGAGYEALGRYDDAIPAFKQYLVHSSDDPWAHLRLAVSYSETGQKEAARAEAARVCRLMPNFSLKMLRPELVGNPASFPRHLLDLREAGLS